MPLTSTFLTPCATSTEGNLAILHLRRDQSLPTILSAHSLPDESTGYAEGVVTNTRFGSFPHTTLVDRPWGTQVRASIVDTGSRGRAGKKRKREDGRETEDGLESLKEAVTASSGFLHILPPTPENWTSNLPHRTQVVYTPDYSYILHRIKARPGSVLIEAGSGSGSFTHAAIRAVFNGYPEEQAEPIERSLQDPSQRRKRARGHVYTYEYHAERYRKVTEEMTEHGLSSLVTTTHRDVYNNGFGLNAEKSPESPSNTQSSPLANAIFLDLPSPWLALTHLKRQQGLKSQSPLDPASTVHICTFSPCIEQAQRTVSSLRRHGWVDIEMVEMAQKRIDVRREYTGFEYDGMRSCNGSATNVEDAVERLKEVEERAQLWRGHPSKNSNDDNEEIRQVKARLRPPTEPEKREAMKLKEKTLYKEGRLVHRSEPELKTHTSYLTFAILPREWSEEDEMKMRAKWGSASAGTDGVPQGQQKKSKKQQQREAKQRQNEKQKVSEQGGSTGSGVSKVAEREMEVHTAATIPT